MKEKEIKHKLLNNKHDWDKKTIDVLTSYFYELFLTIGNFIDVDDILKKFVESDSLKNGIIYVDDNLINNKYDAVYNYKDLCVKVAKNVNDENYIKYVLFHELTHALSNNGEVVGFYNCEGLNEGTTELISLLRNNKIGYRFSKNGIYNIVSSLSYLLGYILGYSNMFYSYFYDGNKLEKLIEENGMIYEEIKSCFDFFIDEDERFIDMKFNEKFIDYSRMIIYNFFDFFGNINNLIDFENKIKFISLYVKTPYSLNLADEYSTYVEIMMNKETLLELNCNEEEIDNILKKYELYDLEKFEKYKNINMDEKENNN